jgi:hypothetical protein
MELVKSCRMTYFGLSNGQREVNGQRGQRNNNEFKFIKNCVIVVCFGVYLTVQNILPDCFSETERTLFSGRKFFLPGESVTGWSLPSQ